jgi:hypothetical protein
MTRNNDRHDPYEAFHEALFEGFHGALHEGRLV